MRLYSGIDLHSNNSVVAMLDEQDRVVYERRHANDLHAIVSAGRESGQVLVFAFFDFEEDVRRTEKDVVRSCVLLARLFPLQRERRVTDSLQ